MAKQNVKSLLLRLVVSEYDEFREICSEVGMLPTQMLRALIQGMIIANRVQKNKTNYVEIGGTGYELNPEELEILWQGMADKLQSAIKQKPVIKTQKREGKKYAFRPGKTRLLER